MFETMFKHTATLSGIVHAGNTSSFVAEAGCVVMAASPLVDRTSAVVDTISILLRTATIVPTTWLNMRGSFKAMEKETLG
jgi:hypothetical protein